MLMCNKWWQGFNGFEFGNCERYSSWFAKNNYMDKKIKQRELGVGKGMH